VKEFLRLYGFLKLVRGIASVTQVWVDFYTTAQPVSALHGQC